MGKTTYQLVQDFSHQQNHQNLTTSLKKNYLDIMGVFSVFRPFHGMMTLHHSRPGSQWPERSLGGDLRSQRSGHGLLPRYPERLGRNRYQERPAGTGNGGNREQLEQLGGCLGGFVWCIFHRGWHTLEDHPSGCRWLIAMVNKPP